jgi:ParB family chromosome partitioning protein
MTKHSDIQADQTDIAYVPLKDLTLSKLNPRQGDLPIEDIDALADSIRLSGLIQNLSGLRRKASGKVEIVAGGRRLRALKRLAEKLPDHAAVHSIPVKITSDPLIAESWANIENAARQDLDPAEEIRAYGRMAKTGIDPETIATAFAVSEAHVKRRLKLAQLPKAVLDALANKIITLETAQAFTTCDDAKRSAEALAMIESGDLDNQRQLRAALHPQSLRGSDRKVIFVGLDAYEAAGGTLTRDMFTEDVYVADAALVESLFAQKLEDEANRIEAEGWKWVNPIEDHYLPYELQHSSKVDRIYRVEGVLSEIEAEEYDALCDKAASEDLGDEDEARLAALDAIQEGDYTDDQRRVAGGWVYVNQKGNPIFQAGNIRPEDKADAIAAGVIEKRHAATGAQNAAEAKPALSEALRGDLSRMATGARQNALLADPTLALHLLAFQLCGKMEYARAFGLSQDHVSNHPSTETGFALDARLTPDEPEDFNYAKRDLGKDFAKFRKQGDAKIMDQLHAALTNLLSVNDSKLGAMIDKAIKKNTRDVFTPTAENFFKRVNAAFLQDLWSDLLGLKADHPTITSFAKLKKGEKADKLEQLFADPETRKALKLTKAQEKRIATWLPEGMI